MKRIWSTFALVLVAAVLAGCSQPAPAPSPVDEIVASNLEARGGVERIRALHSVRQIGTATASGGRVAKIVREMQRPGRVRLEFAFQGTTSVFAHDGTVGWQVAPLQGQFEPRTMSPEEDSVAGVDQRDLEGPLVDWRDKGSVVELEGEESLPGGEAFKLKITLADGSVRHDYVDVATRLVVRSDVTRTVRGQKVLMSNSFSDFRAVDGLVFPHVIETRTEGRPEVLTITVDRIELDPDLDPERFSFPEAGP